MTTNERIDRITEELREIYNSSNEGPRLIHEMVKREFPYPRRVWNEPDHGTSRKGGWGIYATDMVRR